MEKKWTLKTMLPTLLELAENLMSERPLFFLLSCHDKEFSRVMLGNMLEKMHFTSFNEIETGSLILRSEKGTDLQSGLYSRWRRS